MKRVGTRWHRYEFSTFEEKEKSEKKKKADDALDLSFPTAPTAF